MQMAANYRYLLFLTTMIICLSRCFKGNPVLVQAFLQSSMSWSPRVGLGPKSRSIGTITTGRTATAAGSTRSGASVTLTDALSSKLQDPSLLSDWNLSTTSSNSDTVTTFGVYDPGTQPQTLLAHVPSTSSSIVNETIQRSHNALPQWRDSTTAAYRANLLTEWSRLITQNIHDLATIMTLESGKPMVESMGEIRYATSFLDFYAGEAIRSTNAGFLLPTPFVQSQQEKSTTTTTTLPPPPPPPPRGQILVRHQAVGVVAMITPWNFPSAMMTRKIGPALAAGCTTVVKPSEWTPLSAIALTTLAYRVGIPRDVVALLPSSTADTPMIGQAFCSSPLIQKISFTGSTQVGKWLLEQSASTVKRLSLELGGNAPFVVFDDADLDVAVTAAIASKFRNAGQTCVCADRFLVHASVYDKFVQQLIAQTRTVLRVGHGLDPSSTMGPLISVKAVDSVDTKVQQAISLGAICYLGGNRIPKLGPQFYEPTILGNVPLHSDIWKTEVFGPVIAIRSFDTDDEALAIANDSSAGLASYFCTNNLSRAFRFSERLEYGIVGVNEGIVSSAVAPFGGVKESGLGREGSSMGLAEYLETKYIFMNY